MNIVKNSQQPLSSEQENHTLQWTAGPIISSHKRKGFDHTGTVIKVVDMVVYTLEVFPPRKTAKQMEQPAPDVAHHLEEEGVDISNLHRRFVSFVAHVSLPYRTEDSAVEITLKSEQPQNGGVYELETCVPQNMICARKSPINTVLDSLNNALLTHHWYPPY